MDPRSFALPTLPVDTPSPLAVLKQVLLLAASFAPHSRLRAVQHQGLHSRVPLPLPLPPPTHMHTRTPSYQCGRERKGPPWLERATLRLPLRFPRTDGQCQCSKLWGAPPTPRFLQDCVRMMLPRADVNAATTPNPCARPRIRVLACCAPQRLLQPRARRVPSSGPHSRAIGSAQQALHPPPTPPHSSTSAVSNAFLSSCAILRLLVHAKCPSRLEIV
jgi:hypothetical protein